MKSLPFCYETAVYPEDTDYGGIVYHTNYLKYMERTRTEWLKSIGQPLSELAKHQIFFVLRQANIDFIKPAKLNDELSISCEITDITRTQLIFEQSVKNKFENDCVYAFGWVKLVCVNFNFKPARIPVPILEALNHAG